MKGSVKNKFNIMLVLMLMLALSFPVCKYLGGGVTHYKSIKVVQPVDAVGKVIEQGNKNADIDALSSRALGTVIDNNSGNYSHVNFNTITEDGIKYCLIDGEGVTSSADGTKITDKNKAAIEQLKAVNRCYVMSYPAYSGMGINNTYIPTYHNYKLMVDIDLTGVDWYPIGFHMGTRMDWNLNTYGFTGIFDGNGHTISNMKIKQKDVDPVTDYYTKSSYSRTDQYKVPVSYQYNTSANPGHVGFAVYAGLFSKLSGATVKNLQLKNPTVELRYTTITAGTGLNVKDREYSPYVGCLAGLVDWGIESATHLTNDYKYLLDKKTEISNISIINPNINVEVVHPRIASSHYTKQESVLTVGGLVGCTYQDTNITNCVVNGGSIETLLTAESQTDGGYLLVGGLVGCAGLSGEMIDYPQRNDRLCSDTTITNSYSNTNIGVEYWNCGLAKNNGLDQRKQIYLGGITGAARRTNLVINRCFAVLNSSTRCYSYAEVGNTPGQDQATTGYQQTYINFQPIIGGVHFRDGLSNLDPATMNISNVYYNNSSVNAYGRTFLSKGVNTLVGTSSSAAKSVDWFSSTDCLNWLNS